MVYILLHHAERVLRRERVFRDRTKPLDIYDDTDMFKKYRFTRAGVQTLIDRLGGQLEHQTQRNHAVPPSLQVFIALRFYATGSVLDNSAAHHGVSIPTASRIVRSVTRHYVSWKMNYMEVVSFEIGKYVSDISLGWLALNCLLEVCQVCFRHH